MSKHFGELQLLLKLSPSPLLLINRLHFHYPGFMYPISNLSFFCLFHHYCYIYFSPFGMASFAMEGTIKKQDAMSIHLIEDKGWEFCL